MGRKQICKIQTGPATATQHKTAISAKQLSRAGEKKTKEERKKNLPLIFLLA
jgi:hypothetical protein